MSESELFITSIEGPNHIGKGTLADRVMYILAVYANYIVNNGQNSFRVARVVEPPDIPIVFPNTSAGLIEAEKAILPKISQIRASLGPDYWRMIENQSRLGGNMTWRNVLKGGEFPDFLSNHCDAISIDARFAEGFLTSRAIVESFMRDSFHWDPLLVSPSFVEMIRIRNERQFGVYNGKILVKDRGTGSTDVFQGDDLEVQELIRGIYGRGELTKEDVTFVLIPSNVDKWLKSRTTRDSDVDIHDVQRAAQLHRYLNLRQRLGPVYSKDIVYIENDTTGVEFHFNQVPFMIALVILLRKKQGTLNWYDEGDGINSINLNLLHLVNVFGSYGRDEAQIPTFMTDFCFPAFYERSHPKYFYKGVPLLYYSGDVGIIYQGPRHLRRNNLDYTEVILAKDLRNNVVYNEKYY